MMSLVYKSRNVLEQTFITNACEITHISDKVLTKKIIFDITHINSSVLNCMGRVLSWVTWVQCHRAFVDVSQIQSFFSCVFVGPKFFLVGISRVPIFFSWVFHGSKIFSCRYFVGPKFYLVSNFVIFSQYLTLLILFQINFNNCELRSYQKGTTSTKLLILLRSFSLYQSYFQSSLSR